MLNVFQRNDFDGCVGIAVACFQEEFTDHVEDLLRYLPADKLDETGRYVWRGRRRCPVPIKFDVNDEMSFEFVYSCASLLCEILQIELRDRDYCSALLKSGRIIAEDYLLIDRIALENPQATDEEIKSYTRKYLNELEGSTIDILLTFLKLNKKK